MSRRGKTRRSLRTPHGSGGPENAPPASFRWIVDGHNAIFAVSAWEGLQIQGRRREARRALEESLEAFGRAVGVQVWVVFDGNTMERNPDAVAAPHLRTEYSYPPEEADDRIRYLAQACLRAAERPVVVTSDRLTLASSLPPGVRWMEVGRFFRLVHARALHRPEKWEPTGMEDLERHFLLQSPFESDRSSVPEPAAEDAPPATRDPDAEDPPPS
jgi:predicted RNA-binding protein with PIN domain